MTPRALLIALGTCSVVTQAATASVLTEKNAPLKLCSAGQNSVVDPDLLAIEIIGAAGANTLLPSLTGTTARAAVLEVSQLPGGDPSVFGPPSDPKAPLYKAAAGAILLQMADITRDLSRAAIPGPDRKTVWYRVTDRRADQSRAGTARDVLSNPAQIILGCEAAAMAPPPPAPQNGRTGEEEGAGLDIRLRGEIKDLWVPRIESGQIGQAFALKTKPARIAFNRDLKADTTLASLTAVLGLSLPIGERLHLIPFGKIDRTEADGQDDDVNALTPGLLLSYAGPFNPSFSYELGLETSLLFDQEHEARKGIFRAYFDPGFYLGRGRGVLFDSNLRLGPLLVRPELSLLAESGWVFDEGDSAELAGDQSYVGLGAHPSVRARLDPGGDWGRLADFVFRAGVRELRVVAGDIGLEDIRRWTASLEFAPADWPYLGFGFTFEEGDNPETFQSEEFYRLGVTLRY